MSVEWSGRSAIVERRDWLDIARGIGIGLVVVKHFDTAKSPPEYWYQFQDLVSIFRLPLMFLISGYLFRSKSAAATVQSRGVRLLVPFASVAAIFLVFKLVASSFAPLTFPVCVDSCLRLAYDPIHSFVPLLWYLPALFIISVLVAAYRSRFKSMHFLLVLSIAVFLPWRTTGTILDGVVESFPFFVGGAMAIPYIEKFGNWSGMGRLKVASISLALVLFGWRETGELPSWCEHLVHLVAGMGGAVLVCMASLGLATSLGAGPLKRGLVFLGRGAMAIYLFHPLFESGVRIALAKFRTSEVPFQIQALVACSAGILGPALLRRCMLGGSPWLRMALLGEKSRDVLDHGQNLQFSPLPHSLRQHPLG